MIDPGEEKRRMCPPVLPPGQLGEARAAFGAAGPGPAALLPAGQLAWAHTACRAAGLGYLSILGVFSYKKQAQTGARSFRGNNRILANILSPPPIIGLLFYWV